MADPLSPEVLAVFAQAEKEPWRGGDAISHAINTYAARDRALAEAQAERDGLEEQLAWIYRKIVNGIEGYAPPTDDRNRDSEIKGKMHVLVYTYNSHQRLLPEVDKQTQTLHAREHELEALRGELAAERAIVDRVWRALGIETYDQAKPLAIDEHVRNLRGEVERLTTERDEARRIVERVNNTVLGSEGYFTKPDCVEAIDNMKRNANRQYAALRDAEAALMVAMRKMDETAGSFGNDRWLESEQVERALATLARARETGGK